MGLFMKDRYRGFESNRSSPRGDAAIPTRDDHQRACAVTFFRSVQRAASNRFLIFRREAIAVIRIDRALQSQPQQSAEVKTEGPASEGECR